MEAASNCNPTGKEAGALDAEVSANGLSELAASTVAVSFKELEGYMVAPPAIFKVRVAGTTYSDTANRYTEGNAIITSLEENGVTEDIVTFSVTFNLKDIDLTP
ncbi:hypothetical protein FJZ26_05585 [Candidatus Parvarchaeota archaeon]|nr:hypothetical protein [Candidatus Parvarchaeota archaeon]